MRWPVQVTPQYDHFLTLYFFWGDQSKKPPCRLSLSLKSKMKFLGNQSVGFNANMIGEMKAWSPFFMESLASLLLVMKPSGFFYNTFTFLTLIFVYILIHYYSSSPNISYINIGLIHRLTNFTHPKKTRH